MRTKERFLRRVCLGVALFLMVIASRVDAKSPGSESVRTKGIVAVHVNDGSGALLASATGVMIDGRGVVATSCYVIPKWLSRVENTLVVETENGGSLPIQNLLSRNCNNDIALIQVRGSGLSTADLAPKYMPEQGEHVSLVTMTPGPVVMEGRVRAVTRKNGLFQSSVPVTPGRDGSAVLNRKGEVIGIATFLPSKKQAQSAIIPAGNVEKEFGKYRNLILDLPLASSPVIPPPQDRSDVRKADLAPPANEQREKKYTGAERAYLAACSYDRAHRYREAIDAYTRAISMKHDYAEAYMGLGLVYYKTEKFAEAVEAYKKALKIKPRIQSAYNKLGATYIILGEYAKALDAYKQSIALDPKNSEAHFNLGLAYVLTGDRDGAATEYAVLKELDKTSAEKLLNLMY